MSDVLDKLQYFLLKEDFVIWMEKNYSALYKRLLKEYHEKRVKEIREIIKKP